MKKDKIIIKGARVHNLQNIDLELPNHEITVFTGLSGSGKSSLAFDTIFAEGQRRYIESLSPYIRQFLGQLDRPAVDDIEGLSPAIAIDQKALSHNPRSTVGTLTEIYDYLRVLFARLGEVYCPQCGDRIEKLSLEEIVDTIQEKAETKKTKVITVLSPVVLGRKGEYFQLLYDFLNLGFADARIDGKFHSLHEKVDLSRYSNHTIEIVIDKLQPKDETRIFEAVENALEHSKGLVTIIFDNQEEILLSSRWSCPKDNFSYGEIEPRLFSFNSPYGACQACFGLGCDVCQGKRLRPEALSIKIKNKNIFEVTKLTLGEAQEFFQEYQKRLKPKQLKIAANVLKEISERLHFLNEVGLEYLTLGREAETLSGGEAQRIRLASQIGAKLAGALYVLDEPTIGLHERDTERLIKTLHTLKERNNTLIIVEHDEMTIKSADYLVDLGPGAGNLGGKVVAQGKVAELLQKNNKEKSLTLDYLRKIKKIEVPKKRRNQNHGFLKIIGAKINNLKNIKVEIPLQRLVCLTGVSGSGKSSLLYDVVYKNIQKKKNNPGEQWENVKEIKGLEYLQKVVMVDQSPIGRTPRSNPATYTGILGPIRDLYAVLPAARERGYKPGRFSFNVADGRCGACQGAGYNLIEMHFLPPVWVECDVCHGKRFNRETLQVKYKNKNIADVLAMTITEAKKFFSEFFDIRDKLQVLEDVGLGYLKLGQSAPTLSGGEAQRIKLGKELIQPLGRRVLYMLDEPTVGLHYQDLDMLLKVLQKLVDRGHSVIVIEHNMHMIKCADYVIDLGPEGGEAGGKVIATGTPEDIAESGLGYTGLYLAEYLK